MSDQQMQSYFQQNGLADPKAPGGIGEFLTPLAFIAGSALGGPVGGSIAAANGSGASGDMGIPGWMQAAGQIAGTAYSGGLNTGGTAGGTPQGFGDGGYGVGSAGAGSAAAAQSGNPFAPGSFWDRSSAMGPTMGNTMSDASPVTASMGGGGVAAGGAMDMYGSGNMATGPNGVMSNDTIFGGTGSNPMPGGGGFFDWLGSSIGKTGLTGKDLGMAGLQMFAANQVGSRLNAGANSAGARGDPMQQPGRAPFQQMAQNMAANPLNTPFTQNYLKMGQNMMDAGAAKSGNTANVAASTIPQVMTGLAGDYNNMMNTLQGFGGYNQSPGYGATSYAGLQQPVANANMAQYQGLANLFGKSSGVQANANSGGTPATNPFSGANTFKA
jgi:hypothetical protein